MARTKASRKYQLTINNPLDHGFSHSHIKELVASFAGVEYWCICDEIGTEGTPHTHVYFCSPNAIQFSTVQQRFYGAHIETAKGTHRENRDYIRKEGKWLNDTKHETSLLETFEESGELPPERSKRETVSAEILDEIQAGATNAEILRNHPGAMTRLPHIEASRQTLLEEEYRNKWRNLEVMYIHGAPGSGKTRFVMEKYGYSNVCRVTNYDHPYDGYKGQDVILFDEFRSSRPIAEMLDVLDGYPLNLPCRYADKVACYTKVYIVSNIPLEKQYPNVQASEPATFQALLRRIHHVVEFSSDDGDMPF